MRKSWWVDFRHEKRRYRVRSPDNSRAGALAYEAVLRARLAHGAALLPDAAPRGKTFAEFAGTWLETYARTNNKPTEVKAKTCALRAHLVPWFGGLLLDGITAAGVEQFKANMLASGLAPKTVNNQLTILRKCLRTAAEWGELGDVPAIRPLRVALPGFDFLNVDEAERLMAAAASSPWAAMVTLALHTGMRIGELCALSWTDVDFGRRMITVRRSVADGVFTTPKNNRVRHVPLTGRVLRDLRALHQGAGLVFSPGRGRPWGHDAVSRALHRLCASAGLRRVGWHTLRHSFASHLATAGVPLRAIQELLGHSTLHMTLRYAHLAPSALRDAVAVLEGVHEAEAGQPVGNAPVAVPSTAQWETSNSHYIKQNPTPARIGL